MAHALSEHKKSEDRHYADFYATNPDDVEIIVQLENLKGLEILEPCAGMGHMANVLKKYNTVTTNELFNYGYETDYNVDFTSNDVMKYLRFDAVVMNPPYKLSDEFILTAYRHSDIVIVFQKISMLEGQTRHEWLYKSGHLKKVYIYSYRTFCAKDGNFSKYDAAAVAYAWYFFDKNYYGKTELSWITKEDLQQELF